ncbi:hypothetical protein AB3S75_039815 [Citrus x aurantiifolia]
MSPNNFVILWWFYDNILLFCAANRPMSWAGHIQHSRDKNVICKFGRLRFSVGPFTIPSPISEDAKQLILYLFDEN